MLLIQFNKNNFSNYTGEISFKTLQNYLLKLIKMVVYDRGILGTLSNIWDGAFCENS